MKHIFILIGFALSSVAALAITLHAAKPELFPLERAVPSVIAYTGFSWAFLKLGIRLTIWCWPSIGQRRDPPVFLLWLFFIFISSIAGACAGFIWWATGYQESLTIYYFLKLGALIGAIIVIASAGAG